MDEQHALVPAARGAHEPELIPIPLLGVLRLQAHSWCTRRAAEAQLVILEARRRVAEAARTTEEAEADLALHRAVRAVPPEQGREILGREIEIERLLLERHQLRCQRRGPGATGTESLPLALPAAIEWEISDEQIQALAVRAVTRFSSLDPAEAERAFAAWKRELGMRLPPYAAAEVARSAEQLRSLAR